MFNIPKEITQGDHIFWSENLLDCDCLSDTLKCFFRGPSKLDLIATPNAESWGFVIDSDQSNSLTPGKYFVQFAVYENGTKKKTIGDCPLVVSQSFENIDHFDPRSDDEKELEELNKALNKGITEYRIGDRMVQYHSLKELSDRQQYLRNRIAIAQGKIKPGGRNIKINFCGQ